MTCYHGRTKRGSLVRWHIRYAVVCCGVVLLLHVRAIAEAPMLHTAAQTLEPVVLRAASEGQPSWIAEAETVQTVRHRDYTWRAVAYRIPGKSNLHAVRLFYAKPDASYTLALHQMVGDGTDRERIYISDGRFDGIELLRLPTFNADGQRIGWEWFCFIEFTYSGTGYAHNDQLYHLERDGTINRVNWKPAGKAGACDGLKFQPGQGVWKGEQHFASTDAQQMSELGFVFYIWNKNDGNCCPTGGVVKGAYHVQVPAKDGDAYKLVVDRWHLNPEVPR